LEDVSVKYRGGLLIRLGDKLILADPRRIPPRKPDLVLVSHGHSDHFSARALRALSEVPKLMSTPTWELVDPRKRLRNVVTIEEGEEIEIAGLTVAAYSAGHIIGSLQFLVSHRVDLVYTGDICTEDRILLKPARPLRCDVLVIEATYGSPKYIFPPRRELYRAIVELSKSLRDRGLVLAGRRIGVTQELTALLSFSKVATPLVHNSVARINAIYERYGELLGSYVVTDSTIPPRGVSIVPLNAARKREALPCTGWAAAWKSGIPLSSHSDFERLLNYVKLSSPQEVYTVYGFVKELASAVRERLGIEARPVK